MLNNNALPGCFCYFNCLGDCCILIAIPSSPVCSSMNYKRNCNIGRQVVILSAVSHRRSSSRHCHACRSQALSRWFPLPVNLQTLTQNWYVFWVGLFAIMCSNANRRWFLQLSSRPTPRRYLTTTSAQPLLLLCQMIMVQRGTSWRRGYF